MNAELNEAREATKAAARLYRRRVLGWIETRSRIPTMRDVLVTLLDCADECGCDPRALVNEVWEGL